MTIHHNLPIYKECYELLGMSTDLVKNMPRDFKASMGRKIHEECIDMLVLVARANAAKGAGKVPHLEQLQESLSVTEILIRLSTDKKLISQKQYAKAIGVTSSIGRQVTGWRKFSANSPAA